MSIVEVYADIWCPFTHVGLVRLAERLDAAQSETQIRVYAWPLELVNGAPMDPAFIGEEVDDLIAQAAPDLFGGFDSQHFPTTTIPALALAEAAYRIDLSTGQAMSFALRDALFERGQDVGDQQVLADIAASLDVPPATSDDTAAVHTAWERGTARGVVGSPHFFAGDGGFFCPGLDIRRVDGKLKIAPDVDAFEDFVEAALRQ